ncbi:WG repeat-containing protein [Gallibacterium melopsittaci]|uniref:WG repeat-containing protein n=1 Tax=Gallibacterium melopsittaci TaxID=516063 RepID=A0ABV6HWU4_9PAST
MIINKKIIINIIQITITLTLLNACFDNNAKECKNLFQDNNKKSLAFSFCEKAAQQGDSESQIIFADLLLADNKTEEALNYLYKAGNQKNPEASFKIAELYSSGKYVKQDLEKASFYYNESCKHDYIQSCQKAEELRKFEQLENIEKEKKELVKFKGELQKQQNNIENEKRQLTQEKDNEVTIVKESNQKKIKHSNFYNGLAVFQDGNLYGYINQQGQIVIPAKFSYAGRFSHGRAAVQSATNNLWGFIDLTGNYIVYPLYKCVGMFSEEEALAGVYYGGDLSNNICEGGKWGYMDIYGNWVINPVLDYAERFSKGKAKVTYQGHTGFINRFGTWVN